MTTMMEQLLKIQLEDAMLIIYFFCNANYLVYIE